MYLSTHIYIYGIEVDKDVRVRKNAVMRLHVEHRDLSVNKRISHM